MTQTDKTLWFCEATDYMLYYVGQNESGLLSQVLLSKYRKQSVPKRSQWKGDGGPCGDLGARTQAGKGHSSPPISEFSVWGGTVKSHRTGWVQSLEVVLD